MHSILVRSMFLRSLSVVIVGAVIAGLLALTGCVRPARIVEVPATVEVVKEVPITVEVEVTREVVVTAIFTAHPSLQAASATPPAPVAKLPAPTATATVVPVTPPKAVSSITPVPGLAEKLRAALVPATGSTAPPTPMATLPAWPLPTFTPSPTATAPVPTVTPVPTPRPTVVSSITPVPGLAEKLREAVVGGANAESMAVSECDATMDDEMLDQMAAWMLDKVNEVRDQNGLGPLVLDGNMSAQSHASAMLRDRYAPLPGGPETYWAGKPHVDRSGRDPYDRWGERGGSRRVRGIFENIWWVSGTVKTCEVDLRAWVSAAMREWMDSDGHRRNLLEPSVDAVSLGFSWGVRRDDGYIDPRFPRYVYRDVYMVQVFVEY